MKNNDETSIVPSTVGARVALTLQEILRQLVKMKFNLDQIARNGNSSKR